VFESLRARELIRALRLNASTNFESRIQALDTSLFDAIPSQTTAKCQKSLLALQRFVRLGPKTYSYLEIGSYLGGSIQPHLLDPLCDYIYSIDKRPTHQPDNRGKVYRYPDNSTERMITLLRAIAPVEKLVCFDNDARCVDPHAVGHAPSLCLIDGEHTTETVITDFEFCRSVCAPDAVICFHDAGVVASAILAILRILKGERAAFRYAKLGGSVYAISLGSSRALLDPEVRKLTRSHIMIRIRWIWERWRRRFGF
jgi:hypothetical protein